MGVVKSDNSIIRKNSAGSEFKRRRINFVEGSNITLTVADDSTDNEVDVTIAASASGGGGQAVALDYGNVTFPNTNYPAVNKTVGTNHVYQTLDFDQTTSEACYWEVPITFTPATAAKIGIWWTASAGSATETFIADIDWRSVANDEVLDATTTPSYTNDTGTDALIATGDVHYFEVTLTSATSAIAAGDLLLIKFSRDVSDTLAADAKVIRCAYFSS